MQEAMGPHWAAGPVLPRQAGSPCAGECLSRGCTLCRGPISPARCNEVGGHDIVVCSRARQRHKVARNVRLHIRSPPRGNAGGRVVRHGWPLCSQTARPSVVCRRSREAAN